jgi:putative tryptophan/tyrosine transport system substrate-binding protein
MIRRREAITLLGSAAAWPITARAQQRPASAIGFLYAGSPGPSANLFAAFRQALAEAGYVEKSNVAIEYRYAEGQYDRLSELAADLVRQQVTVIVATPNTNAARAAKAATRTIPIVCMVSDDPVKLGLVASLNRPGGNVTGVNYFLSELGAKRLGLLRELFPAVARVGVLANPNEATTEAFTEDLSRAASTIGVQLEIVRARDSLEIETAFATLARNKIDALVVAPDTLFVNRRLQIVTLATRHAIPSIYTVRLYVESGGLMSYGPSIPDTYRQLGIYAGRVLKGERPSDLPFVQSTKLDFVINLPTARALALEIPPTLLALADEVIE